MRDDVVVTVCPAPSTAVKLNSAPPERWPPRLTQKKEHASACAETFCEPGPHSMNVCANCAAEFVAPDVKRPLLPTIVCDTAPPAASNRLSVQLVTRRLLAPADTVMSTSQFGCGSAGWLQLALKPTLGLGPTATDGSTR